MYTPHSWASPTRLLVTAITAALIFAIAGCGSGGGGDAATPTTPPPPPANVVLNGVTFNPATSAKLDTGFVLTDFASFSTKIFRVGDQYIDKTLIGGNALTWEDVSWADETVASVPAVKRTCIEYAVRSTGVQYVVSTRYSWFARSTAGDTYILRFIDGGVTAEYTAAGSTLPQIAVATPVVGSPAANFWVSPTVVGSVDAVDVASPGGYTGCVRVKLNYPGGRFGYQYFKPGLGAVEYTKSWIPAGVITPVGTYNLVRPIIGGAG